MAKQAMSSLYHEHLRLGVSFDAAGIPLRYGSGDTHHMPSDDEVMLADLSHVAMLCCSGAPAQDFARTAFAARELRVGECDYEAVLTGDGGLVSIPLAARTGTNEYVLFDLSARHEVLQGWLSFLSAVEQEGVAPFAGLQIDDVQGSHVVLGIYGRRASELLGDYASTRDLPSAGHVASCNLDAIPCIVLNVPVDKVPAYLVLVPPQFGATLWRSFLSFTYVVPCGMDDVSAVLSERLPWMPWIQTTVAVRIPAPKLRASHLLRNSGDFVGARGLSAQE